MARKKTEEAPAGSPAWMATFSDLMNLLLCFFVLLFSMSTVDAEKFEMVIASLQSSFSILPSGGASIGDGEMVSSGVSQLQMYDIYYNQMAIPRRQMIRQKVQMLQKSIKRKRLPNQSRWQNRCRIL